MFSFPSTSSHSSFHSWVSVLGNHDSLYLPVFLSSFEAQVCPIISTLKNLRRVVIFQSVQIFTCYWDGMMTSKLLTCRTKPTIFILIWKCKTWTRTLENCFCTAGCTFLGTSTERFELIRKPRSKKKNAIQYFWEIEKYLKQWDKFMGRLRGALPHWCPLGSIQKNKEEAVIEEKPERVIPKFNTWSVQWETNFFIYIV